MAKIKSKVAAVAGFLAYWLLPDYRHPLRYALREAGLEKTAG
jgi:hypothetical protein